MRTLATAAVLTVAATYGAAPATPATTAATATTTVAAIADVDVTRPDAATRPVRALPVAPAHVHADHEHHHHDAPAQPARRVQTTGRFRTPEAAMRYLASAYNAHDDAALRHVTTKQAREELESMREWTKDLRLTSCWALDDGHYNCTFTHAYVKGKGRGEATIIVAPAAKPGFYAARLEGCG